MFLKVETMVAEKEEGLVFHLEAAEALVIGLHCSLRTILRNFLMRRSMHCSRCHVHPQGSETERFETGELVPLEQWKKLFRENHLLASAFF